MKIKKLIQIIIFLSVFSIENVAYAKEPDLPIQAENQASYDEAIKYYLMIPEGIRAEAEKLGYQIVITPDWNLISRIALGAEYQNANMTVVAVTIEDEAMIYVWDNEKYIKHLVHEMGHVYSDILDNLDGERPYEREAFRNAYRNEGTSLGGYAAGDICEFYAEAFMYYFTASETLMELAPETYDCLESDLTAYEISLASGVRRERVTAPVIISMTQTHFSNGLQELSVENVRLNLEMVKKAMEVGWKSKEELSRKLRELIGHAIDYYRE